MYPAFPSVAMLEQLIQQQPTFNSSQSALGHVALLLQIHSLKYNAATSIMQVNKVNETVTMLF